MYFFDEDMSLKDTSALDLAPLREVLAEEYYDIPYLDCKTVTVPKGKKKTTLNGMINSRIVFLEKVDGALFSMSREGLWCSTKVYKEEEDLLENVWADNQKQFVPGLEYLGVVCLSARKHFYSSLDSFYMIHTIYDQNLQNIISWEETKELAEDSGLDTVPCLLDIHLSFELAKDLDAIASELSRSNSAFGRNNLQGIVARRGGRFMALSGDFFMAQISGQDAYSHDIYAKTPVTNRRTIQK